MRWSIGAFLLGAAILPASLACAAEPNDRRGEGEQTLLPETLRPSVSPPYTPTPPYRTETAADVRANIVSDDFYQSVIKQAAEEGPGKDPRVASAQLGDPIFVRSLRPSMPGGWLVPLISSGKTVGVFSVGRDERGMGVTGGFRGWPYESFPAVSHAQIDALVGPVATRELVWAPVPGFSSGILTPFWRVTIDGFVSYVFADGVLRPAAEVERRIVPAP